MCINNLFNVTISPLIRPISLTCLSCLLLKAQRKTFQLQARTAGQLFASTFAIAISLSLSLSFSIFSPPISFVLRPSLSRQMSEIRLPFTKNRRA